MKVRAVYNFIGKTKSKSELSINQKTHFKTRYFERVGVRCIEPIYQNIMFKLRSGKLKCTRIGDRKGYELKVEAHSYEIIYDTKTDTLVTIF